MVELGGHLATNAGVVISGAAVAVFPTSVNATQATSTDCATTTTTTSSGGDWAVSCLAANTYDVRITCGSSVRWRRYVEEIQVTTYQLGDDGTAYFGAGNDAGIRWSDGDASNHALVVAVGDTSQQVHITDLAAIATDWARSAGTHPELAIHSNTTPILDYLAIGNHDGTTASIDVVGGTTLSFAIAGNTEASITASGLTLPANSDLLFTGGTGTNDIVLTNGLADALSITDGSADVVVVDTSTSGNVITLTSALTVGSDGSGTDVIFYSGTSGDNLTWDASCEKLVITGTACTTSLNVAAGNVTMAEDLTVSGNLTVTGTTTSVDSTTINVTNAFIFEGATADAHETTLGIIDPTADATINLPAMGAGTYYLPVLAAATTTSVTSTPAELNLLDTASANSVVNSKAVIYGSSGELAGTLSTAAQGNVTSLGTLTALTVDDVAINGKVITMTGSSGDTAVFTVGTNGTLSLVTVDTAATAANIQITADGTVDIDSAGVLTLDSGAAINIEPAAGSAILLDGNVSIDGDAVTGIATLAASGVITAGGFTIGSAAITEAELEILDGATVTTAELNVLASLDRGSILYGNASSVTTVLGQGGANEVLTSDGTDIAWAAAAGGGSLTFIATAVASDDATLGVSGIDSTYDTYLIIGSDIVPVDNDKDLFLRLGDSGGIDSGASDYQWSMHILYTDGTTFRALNGADDSHIQICGETAIGGLGNQAGEGGGFALWLATPSDATKRPTINGTSSFNNGTGHAGGALVFGGRQAVIAVTQVEIHMESGNISTGRLTVWGLKHS